MHTTGSQGPPGVSMVGPKGSQGDRGSSGPQGNNGLQGPAGEMAGMHYALTHALYVVCAQWERGHLVIQLKGIVSSPPLFSHPSPPLPLQVHLARVWLGRRVVRVNEDHLVPLAMMEHEVGWLHAKWVCFHSFMAHVYKCMYM